MTHPGDAVGGQARRLVLPIVVLLALASISLGLFGVARRVVADQEEQLLKERTREVSALLANSTSNIQTSLQALGALGSLPDPAAARLFTQSAPALMKGGVVRIGVARATAGGFAVVAGAGDSPPQGSPVGGVRSAVLKRAVGARALVTALVPDTEGKRLILAQPTTGAGDFVAYQESVLKPDVAAPQVPGSPFADLRIALYTSSAAAPSELVLTTEAQIPLTGTLVRAPYPVGADTWLLVVGARGPLVGSFTRQAPWLFLAGGLLASFLAAAVVQTLLRRRSYALRLVEEGTRELKDTQAFLNGLLAAAPVVMRRVSLPEREISYVSPNVQDQFGLAAEEVLGKDFREWVHPEDLAVYESVHSLVERGMADKQSLEYRACLHGQQRWVSALFVPETDAEGTVVAVVGYVVDIDERRQAQQAQTAAQAAADAANQSKSKFLSRMSHELRTPLNAVVGFGQLLELGDLPDEHRESVHQILKGGRHLLSLINEVLDISRIEAGELALSPEPVHIRGLIQDAVDLIRPLGDRRNIQMVVDRAVLDDSYAFADRQRAQQVLLNLLSNAVKYNRDRGTVAIGCAYPDESNISLNVTDTGPGVPAERLSQLFLPFERLGAERSGIEGSGIGLALSKHLVQAMGGTLTATSTLGRGSTFSVTLPRAEGPIHRLERLNPGAVIPSAPQATKRHRLLHIEDNDANLRLIERICSLRSSIDVVASIHGGLGLELAREHQPFLIVLDLHLPDMHGEDVLHALRQNPETAGIPVVVASADATAGQVQRLIAAGAVAYLTKPVDVTELLTLIDKHLPSD